MTMLRHPAAVVDSKVRWYGEWRGHVTRTAAWVLQSLYLERATRESPRVLVHYDELLEDWTKRHRPGGRGARPGGGARRAGGPHPPRARFRRPVIEPLAARLGRRQSCPMRLRAQADEVWALLSALATVGPGGGVAGHPGGAWTMSARGVRRAVRRGRGARPVLARPPRRRGRSCAPRPVTAAEHAAPPAVAVRHALPLRGRVAIARVLRGGEARRAVIS